MRARARRNSTGLVGPAISPADAAAFFDEHYPGQWVYDPAAAVWVVADLGYPGPDKAFVIFHHDGRVARTVVPAEALQ